MRNIWTIAACAAALLAPLPAIAADWYRVSMGGDARWFVDADTIRQDGKWTHATQMGIYNSVGDNGVKSTVSKIEVDCAARTQRFASFAMFDTGRVQLGTMDWPDEGKLHTLTPGTVVSSIGDFVCNVNRASALRVADPFTDTRN